MKIALGTDHAGFLLKEEVKKFLASEGHEVLAMGAHDLQSGDDSGLACVGVCENPYC